MSAAVLSQRLADLAPEPGDIVVVKESASRNRYSVRRFPGRGQLAVHTLEEAMGIGRRFAGEYCVNLWYRDGRAPASAFVERHRPDPLPITKEG